MYLSLHYFVSLHYFLLSRRNKLLENPWETVTNGFEIHEYCLYKIIISRLQMIEKLSVKYFKTVPVTNS